MVAAYETVVFRTFTEFLEPQSLTEPVLKHLELKTVSIGERERGGIRLLIISLSPPSLSGW